jgi:tRNA (guanine37-N1)-methyltransferase
MKIQVITLFPDMLSGPLEASVLGKARQRGCFELDLIDLRKYCTDRHRTADDTPYGGGGGMVMKAEPVCMAVEDCRQKNPGARVVYLSPQGRPLDHAKVMTFSQLPGLVLLCGHYEGLDQRAIDACVDEELSIGDYVLTGGELAAAVLIDAVVRQLPNALGNESSAKTDSFCQGLLDFPHYTRPAAFKGQEVPEVLLSGDHGAVALWRRQQALKATFLKRPDLLKAVALDREDLLFLNALGYQERLPEAAPGKKRRRKQNEGSHQ